MPDPAQRPARLPQLLGALLALTGLVCLGSGLVVLAWRLLNPEEAILLPPGDTVTPVIAPTAALLGTPLAPPPLSENASQLAILPVSERPTATPSQSPPESTRPAATRTPTARPSPTTSHTPPPRRSPAPTRTGMPSPAPSATVSPTPTITPWPSPVPALPERIMIDAIGLNAPVVPVGQHLLTLDGQQFSQWDVPNRRAAGWHQDSARLNERGNVVINGHHNIYGGVFRYLSSVKPGEMIMLESGGKRYIYLVAQTMILAEQDQPVEVRRENARWVLPTADHRLTLVTCWPYESNTHRLIVVALPLHALGLPAELP